MSTEDGGVLEVLDLDLPAGSYTFALSPGGERAVPYLLEAAPLGTRTDSTEIEPNDRFTEANLLGPAVEIAGALVGNEVDYYQFHLGDEEAGFYTLGFDADASAQLCLLDAAETAIYCSIGAGVELADLALAAGDTVSTSTGARATCPTPSA